jgi:hypothetical protein
MAAKAVKKRTGKRSQTEQKQPARNWGQVQARGKRGQAGQEDYLLKTNDKVGVKLYCVCQAPSSKKMIGCDCCEEWYHPLCLGYTEEQLPQIVGKWWECPSCVEGKRPPMVVAHSEGREVQSSPDSTIKCSNSVTGT